MPQDFIASLGGNYHIWEKMYNSLDNAIRTFKVDALSEIMKYNEPVRNRFYGDIGGKSFSSVLPYDYTYRGLRLFSDIKGGTLTLRSISLILNVTEDVVLDIYDEYDLLYSYTLHATAGRPVKTSITPLALNLDRNYYFIYSTSGKPYNNKLTCNCGGHKWCFNIERPCYGVSRENWTQWAMIGGVNGNDLTERDDWNISREAQGLILYGNFDCDIIGSLCDSDFSDFENNEFDLTIAHAIWYKTGEYLANYILSSPEVSRPVLLGTEQWSNNAEFYAARYRAMIEYLASIFDNTRNECLKCRDPHGYKVRKQML